MIGVITSNAGTYVTSLLLFLIGTIFAVVL